MSRYSIEGSTLTAIGDAIRNKSGKLTKLDYVDSKILELNLPYATTKYFEEFPDNAYTVKIKRLSGTYEDFVVWKNLPTNRIFDFDDPNITEVLLNIKEENLYRLGFVHYDSAPQQGNFEIIFYDINNNIIPFLIEVPNVMTPNQMAEEVQNMLSPPSESAFTITGNCSYRFGYNGWNWFIEQFGNKIITKDITTANNMFFQSGNLISIPFDINGKTDGTRMSLSYFFDSCHNLTNIPKIIGKVDSTNNMFNHCRGLRELKEESITELDWSYIDTLTSNYSGNRSTMFQSCYSLRKYPNSFLAHGNPVITYSYAIYYGLFSDCFVLDEIVDLPIQHKAAKWTSNAFNNTFKNCARIKKLTFETNEDGSPIVVNEWSKQTIDLSGYIGYISTNSVASIINYNSGITKDKQVTDAASYQALKNDPDWFSTNIDYSRYNHDSAVETINTLPDLSGGAGGNTIKFKGASGALTDGGAINTLTEEEIAVATAKGWTVSLV